MATRTVLLKTHLLNRLVLEKASLLNDECSRLPDTRFVLCFDSSAGKLQPPMQRWLTGRFETFFFGGAEEYHRLGFPLAAEHVLAKFPVNWYHGDYFLYEYVVSGRPRTDHYWLIEYDVYLAKGAWRDVLVLGDDSDLVAPFLKLQSAADGAHPGLATFPVIADWYWWTHYAGPSPRIGCFFPVIRLSDQLVGKLITALIPDRVGYAEVRVPSVAFESGVQITAFHSACKNRGVTVVHPHWAKRYKHDPREDLVLSDDGNA